VQVVGGRAAPSDADPLLVGGFEMKNVGSIDRLARIIIGLILLSLVFVGPKTAFGWIGIIPLGTALFGFCPAYALFGIRTCPLQGGGKEK
jgi:hypothetical protein